MSETTKRSLDNSSLSKYTIVTEIGRGSMGTVYLGHDPYIGRPVAIKVADEEHLNSLENGELFKQLFFNEAQAAGMLKHPNITAMFDAGADNGFFYIVMEYVPGGLTLENYCRVDNLLPVHNVLQIIYKCATALDYAHKKGVIHRDIKPRNILLTEDMDVKISDFGIAVLPDQPGTDVLIGYAGSPLYMSPEQVRQEEVTARSDLFSLGVVLYELITGKHPFRGGNIAAINHMILNGRAAPLSQYRAETPEILEKIIERALAKSPEHRYKSGMDLAGDLTLAVDFVKPAREDISRLEKLEILRNLEFFDGFPDNEVWEVINASLWQEYPAGTEIVHEGEQQQCFFLIIDGSVLISKGASTIDELHAGDCFGEMGFISGKERSATAVATEQSLVVRINAPLIEQASVNCQLRFHQQFERTLIARLSRATERIARLEQQVPEPPPKA